MGSFLGHHKSPPWARQLIKSLSGRFFKTTGRLIPYKIFFLNPPLGPFKVITVNILFRFVIYILST